MTGVKSNTEIIIKSVPIGMPDPGKTFEIRKSTIDLDKVEPRQNEILVKSLFVSVDPYMRNKLRNPAFVNETMTGGVICQVVKTNNADYSVGDIFVTPSGKWAEYFIINPVVQNIPGGYYKMPNAQNSDVPLSYYLGILGMPGITAYAGLHRICEPLTPGQTLYVSAAAGAVGQVVGQYGKALGLRVVGSAGDDTKVEFLLKDLGFDAAFNYKKHEDFEAILKETCPNGIDIYFENVGGKMLDAVLKTANNHARIAACGMISQYNRPENPEGVHNLLLIVQKNIKMQGFIVSTFKDDKDDCIKTFSKLLQEGKMKYREDISEGIESLPETFVGMLQGKNNGKAIARIADVNPV